MTRRLSCRSDGSAGASDRIFSVALLGACFCIGAIAGFLFGAFSSGKGELSEYFMAYFSSVGHGDLSVSFPSVVWELSQWMLFAVVLCFSRLGLIGLPLLLMIRGFLLSHAISVFVCALGGHGIWAALTVFGVAAILITPALFAVCCDGHCSLRQQSVLFASGERMVLWGVCAVLLVLAIAVQWTLIPLLLSLVCKRLFTV